ncbi:low affinity immunoglobulin gamma Fc region receptor II [Chanos chanos]|uniref:low affinity immunoglobulin gamma Fc region receptor II n=1 Tax=Chanos chanos TaxID=29144 RepID=UPI0011F0DB31|nr:low affinity immunoglobulin gamma Fc region receptor II-like [Chanos chanos]
MGMLCIVLTLALPAVVAKSGSSEGSFRLTLSVWPPGGQVYVGEPVSMRCKVEGKSTGVWRYRWFNGTDIPITSHHQYRVSDDSLFIAAISTSDRGPYRCRAEREKAPRTSVESNRVRLNVTDSPPASLTVMPNSKQHFRFELFSLQCSVANGNSTDWTLWKLRGAEVESGCSRLGGRMDTSRPGECSFPRIYILTGGLYWCQSSTGAHRSNAIHITVHNGNMILESPALPVKEGDSVTLRCQSWFNAANQTIFYKNNVRFSTINGTEITIDKVTQSDEGFYKCLGPNNLTESLESWLSVRVNSTYDSEEGTLSTGVTWIWVLIVPLMVIMLSIPVVWLFLPCFRNNNGFCLTKTSKGGAALQEMPKTKQDATEIQWEQPWVEMANLLDKQ